MNEEKNMMTPTGKRRFYPVLNLINPSLQVSY